MLAKIHIENFKSLKNIDVPCSGLNLLTGVNGAGKSSFVQVLRLLCVAANHIEDMNQKIRVDEIVEGASTKDLRFCYQEKKAPGFCVSFCNDAGAQFELKRVVDDDDVNEKPGVLDVHHPDYADILASAYLDLIKLEEKEQAGIEVPPDEIRAARERSGKVFAERVKKLQEDEGARVDVYNVYRRLWRGARFIDSFRQKPIDVNKGGAYNKLPFMFFDDSMDSRDIQKFSPEGLNTIEFLYKIAHTTQGKNLIDEVNKCLNWVSPGARLDIEEKHVGSREYYVASFDYGVNGERQMFKPQNVGFGLSDILPVLVTLLTAEDGCVLVIENPEAHLHPRGQAEIGKLIAETVSRGVQVFIETHSDHVINGIRVAVKKGVLKPSDVTIAFFERKEHGVVDDEGKESHEIFTTVRDIKIDENGSLSEYPEDFMDEWNNQLMRLM